MRHTSSRRGFTLLEVILALSVAVLLLGGLYVAVDVQLRHARAGRNVVEQATLARSILARIDADIAATATLIDSERYRMANSQSSGSGSSGGASSSAGTATTTTSTGASGGSTGGGTSSGTTTGSTTDAILLPLSVQGDSTCLNLYTSRVPREAMPTDPNAAPQIVSDIRCVSWWLPSSGLARREVPIETAQDALDNLPPGIPDEDSFVIAAEVKNVQFQYFDGTDWQDTWDCTTVGADGLTPIGPPQAIAITVDIAIPQDGTKDDDAPTKRYRHVVACVTANGTTPQQTTQGQQAGTGGTNP
jgi:prepilin-type N-terminal cleavage/methylation domain-containing protein